MTTSEADCVRALRRAANTLDRSPSKAQYEALGYEPASGTIMRVMGGWNAAKEAAGLERYPSTGSKVEPRPPDVEVPGGENWVDLSVDQRWHYRNVEKNSKATLDRRAELRAWVYQLKSRMDGCARCDETNPACLDFHHLEPDQKTMSVSGLIQYEPSEERLLEEIEKCELLCANCHRKEHYIVPDGVE